jgi:flagellar hook protein FlgE
MGSFAIPLSGLTAAQDDLQSVSNNLANINTDGYKDENLTFSDLFSQAGGTNGSGDPLQTGSGVTVASTTSNFTEGTLSATGSASNMALSGNGFFITQGANGLPDYTRAGDFTSNNAGQLTTPDGQLLLGYPALNGVINTSAALQPMQVGSVTSPAVTTKNLEVTANLDAGASLGSAAATTTSSLAVFDSLGGSHTLALSYTMTAPNTWSYTATVPSADLSTGGAGVTTVASGTLNFNSSGVLISTEPTGGTATVAPSAGITLTIPPTTTSPVTTFADGAAQMSAKWNLLDASGNSTITQTATAGATSATNQDGFSSGALTSYAVQPDGTIVGTFSSGTSLDLGQVAVASFGNVEGLASLGDNSYQATAASGSAVVGAAGTGGRGTVVGGSVEQSNVDIATEFAKLIVAQQAYSANAKSITTFNQVSQATLAMIQ